MIRRANETDIPPLVRLVNEAYRGGTATLGWTHEAELLTGQRVDADMLAEILSDPRQSLLVGGDDGGIAACVDMIAKDGFAYLGLLTVDPRRQGRGHGKAMLAAGEAEAREIGLARIEMTVISRRAELIAWYERLGYRRTGAREPFPSDQPRFGIPLHDDLDFVVLEKALHP
jgi:ribosomal protein S18 acetylase RimI-like enzyme